MLRVTTYDVHEYYYGSGRGSYHFVLSLEKACTRTVYTVIMVWCLTCARGGEQHNGDGVRRSRGQHHNIPRRRGYNLLDGVRRSVPAVRASLAGSHRHRGLRG